MTDQNARLKFNFVNNSVYGVHSFAPLRSLKKTVVKYVQFFWALEIAIPLRLKLGNQFATSFC